MPVSKVEVVVLGLLAEEPLYGYGVLERFRARSMGFWAEVGKASVYQALRRMESAGLVTGRDRLRAGLAERAADLSPYETDAGLSLGFAHLLPATEARRAIDARDLAVRDLLDAIKTERARTSADRGAGRLVANAMLDRQEGLAKAELAWLGRFRSSIAKVRR